jgi:hypothetical protein
MNGNIMHNAIIIMHESLATASGRFFMVSKRIQLNNYIALNHTCSPTRTLDHGLVPTAIYIIFCVHGSCADSHNTMIYRTIHEQDRDSW